MGGADDNRSRRGMLSRAQSRSSSPHLSTKSPSVNGANSNRHIHDGREMESFHGSLGSSSGSLKPSPRPSPRPSPSMSRRTATSVTDNQPSLQAKTPTSDAIVAFGVRRAYGSGKSRSIVLKDLDLVLPRGKIYGLLGPSGCGKSTFLKCVTGRLKIHQGKLAVLGKKPNSANHDVPGRLIGYMPQEEALYAEFTVDETVSFCAALHGVTSQALTQKKTFLYGLLELEGISNKMVKNLSGGQKRRVSFACALVHSPQLLVLDEPTVGVDPLLRAKLWAYLQHLTSMDTGPSILITTHYIEEARQADVVGMMRDGNLLAEDSPEVLLNQYSCDSLEEVFLLLCRGHGKFNLTDGRKPPKPKPSMITYQGASTSTHDPSRLVGQRELKKRAKTLRERLLHFYKERNPNNLDKIDAIMIKYEGREDELWAALLEKYPTRIRILDEDDPRTDEERAAEFLKQSKLKMEKEKEEALAAARAAQSLRWKTEVWDGENDLLSSKPSSIMDEDTLERQQLLSRPTGAGDPALDPQSVHGWVPYQMVNEKAAKRGGCWRNTCALTWKNFTKLKRSFGFLLFLFALPTLQVALFCTAIGGDPKDLSVAVLNDDLSGNYSTMFLNNLDSNAIVQTSVHTESSGADMVKDGKAWGFIHIPKDFTESWSISSSDKDKFKTISLQLDSTQQQISLVLIEKANEAFKAVMDDIAIHTDPSFVNIINTGPIDASHPIYGSAKPSFTNFVAPGIMVTITFAQAIGLTAIAFVQDKKDGLLDRCWAAGVKPGEIMIAHVLTQFLVLVIQTAAMIAVALYGFKVPHVGSVAFVAVLMLLLGLVGMTLGLLISTLSSSEVGAMQVAMGTFFPSMLLSGIIWPLQAIPTWLKYISYALPTTWAAESMRSILLRGWGISEQGVWAGFVAGGGYFLLMILLAIKLVRNVD